MTVLLTALLLAASSVRPAAIPISFSEFLQDSTVLAPSARLLSLNGKRVRLVGFMARMEVPPRGGFYLCPPPVSADESGGGTADLPVESVLVVMRSARGREVAYRPGPLEVIGILQVGSRTDEEGRVAGFQITLDPPAPRRRVPPSHSPLAKGESK